MYALAEAALADARIAYWESKYFYNFWRPITAIRVGDQDGNPATEVDPAWQPLINTPHFPSAPLDTPPPRGAISHVLRFLMCCDFSSAAMC